MKLPTLYSLDKKNRIRLWQIEHEDDKFRTTEGLQYGKMQTTAWTICLPTNEGRSNARTATEQAAFEAQARWDKKVKEGATPDIENVAICQDWFEPMLAHKYLDRAEKVKFPIEVQAKLDGHRCLVYLKDGKPYAQTRKGKPILSVPHILKSLEFVFEEQPNFIFDGELYNHELKEDFEKITSLVRKQKVTPESLEESKRLIQYHIYDCFYPPIPDLAFELRRMHLITVEQLVEDNQSIRIVPTETMQSAEELEEYEDQAISNGYEGVMVRIPDSSYESGRSFNLLKLKRFDDAEFELLDLQEGLGNRMGLATRAILRLNDETTFDAGVVGNDTYTAKLLAEKDKWIGKQWTVKYKGLSNKGIPKFAKLLRPRID